MYYNQCKHSLAVIHLTINISFSNYNIYLLFSLQHYLLPFHPLTTSDTLHKCLLLHIKDSMCSLHIRLQSFIITPIFFSYNYTIGESNAVNTGPVKQWLPSLTTLTPFKSQKILFNKEHWVGSYSNQKAINYISPSNCRASVETRPP